MSTNQEIHIYYYFNYIISLTIVLHPWRTDPSTSQKGEVTVLLHKIPKRQHAKDILCRCECKWSVNFDVRCININIACLVWSRDHITTNQMVQQLSGIFLHSNGEICAPSAYRGNPRSKLSDSDTWLRAHPCTQPPLQQVQRF